VCVGVCVGGWVGGWVLGLGVNPRYIIVYMYYMYTCSGRAEEDVGHAPHATLSLSLSVYILTYVANWILYMLYTLYNLQYIAYNMQYIQYIQYTIYNILYTIYNIYNILYIGIYAKCIPVPGGPRRM